MLNLYRTAAVRQGLSTDTTVETSANITHTLFSTRISLGTFDTERSWDSLDISYSKSNTDSDDDDLEIEFRTPNYVQYSNSLSDGPQYRVV